MTEAEALKTVALLSAAFPAQPWPEPTLKLWAKALERFRYIDARTAIGRLLTAFGRDRPLRCDDVVQETLRVVDRERSKEREAELEKAYAALPGRTERRPEYPRLALDTVQAIAEEQRRRERSGIPVMTSEETARFAQEDFEARLRCL